MLKKDVLKKSRQMLLIKYRYTSAVLGENSKTSFKKILINEKKKNMYCGFTDGVFAANCTYCK
jgi:hypothetical protein